MLVMVMVMVSAHRGTGDRGSRNQNGRDLGFEVSGSAN